jgi:murein L,D-transpeptidase YafK
MTPKKKTPIGTIIQWIGGVLGFVGLFAGLIGGAVAWGEWKAESQERMFKDSNERVITEQHVAEPFSRYKMQLKNDSILMQQSFLSTAFDTINKRHSNDEEDKSSRIASRNKRDSTYAATIDNQRKSDSIQKKIQREQIIQTNTNQLILQELKSLRVLIDTNH